MEGGRGGVEDTDGIIIIILLSLLLLLLLSLGGVEDTDGEIFYYFFKSISYLSCIGNDVESVAPL